jgi:glycolate oxidase iron-sulfur subunit
MDHDSHRSTEAGATKVPSLDLPELYNCVHCGLCLNQCPTYRALRLEPESPRGRIHLVKAAAEGRIELNARFREHIDLCLLCRACETACPSGVRYGRIAETVREHLGPGGSWLSRCAQKFVFTRLLPYPRRLRQIARLLRLYQRSGLQKLLGPCLPRKLRAMDAMLPAIPGAFYRPSSVVLPAKGEKRARVALLNGCVMPLLFGAVNAATVRVLRRNGCEVVVPGGQVCCGALNLHNGESAAAKRMAAKNIDAFLQTGADAIVVNAAGCGAAMKEYDYLLRDDLTYAGKAAHFGALVKDAGEFLAGLGLRQPLGALPLTVTYQDPCHLAHGQKIRGAPRSLLAAIPELKLMEAERADSCCGSAGIYNVTHPEMSELILDEKMRALAATGAAGVVAPNPGCMLQLRHGAQARGMNLEVFHLMDLLDRSYAAAGSEKHDDR